MFIILWWRRREGLVGMPEKNRITGSKIPTGESSRNFKLSLTDFSADSEVLSCLRLLGKA